MADVFEDPRRALELMVTRIFLDRLQPAMDRCRRVVCCLSPVLGAWL